MIDFHFFFIEFMEIALPYALILTVPYVILVRKLYTLKATALLSALWMLANYCMLHGVYCCLVAELHDLYKFKELYRIDIPIIQYISVIHLGLACFFLLALVATARFVGSRW